MLTLWRYCFYNDSNENVGRARFSIYGREPDQDGYFMKYSEPELSIDMDPHSPAENLTCGTLTPSSNSVKLDPGDVIVACIRSSSPLNLLSETIEIDSGYQVYASEAGRISTCDNFPEDISNNELDNSYQLRSDFVLHVFAG